MKPCVGHTHSADFGLIEPDVINLRVNVWGLWMIYGTSGIINLRVNVWGLWMIYGTSGINVWGLWMIYGTSGIIVLIYVLMYGAYEWSMARPVLLY